MATYWNSDHTLPIRETDIAIIGAGVAGLSAALALQGAGVACVLLEQGDVGSGASTRNAGYLMRGAADNYKAAIDDLGREQARDLWRATEDNLKDLLALGVADVPTFERRPSTLLAYDEDEASDLQCAAVAMREDGFNTELVTSGTDTLWQHAPPRVALVNPDDAVVNPARLIAWLRGLVTVPLVEQTGVFEMREHEQGVLLRSSKGDLAARRVLVCTNAWTARLVPSLPVQANRGQMLALRVPQGVRLDHAYYANRGSEYIRQAASDTVVVGGWRKHFENDERTDRLGVTIGVQQGLEDFAANLLGDRHPVSHRWGGIMGFTPDGLPRVGPTGDSRRVWACTGFTGHGMSLAHRTATLTARTMLEGGPPPPWTRPAR